MGDSTYQTGKFARTRETVEKAEILVDPTTGIIKNLYQVALSAGDPPLSYYIAKVANTSRFSTLTCIQTSSGVSLSKERAIASVIGEAIERYSPTMHYECEKDN